jgi:mannitol/fructose-specific phosphotransferase system IIA component (Ntr-type)
MTLSSYIEPDAVSLALAGADRSAVLAELVSLLKLPPAQAEMVHRLLLKREESGSTGVGHGIAIPHTRCLAVDRIRVAYGYHREGLEWGGIDGARVHQFFLIVAPPAEGGGPYLSVLSRVAHLVKEARVREQLVRMATAPEVIALIEEQGV